MKALMAANQLAALEQEQLLQIRELLLQEKKRLKNAEATPARDKMRAAVILLVDILRGRPRGGWGRDSFPPPICFCKGNRRGL